jgi:hypothetical protein
MLIFHKSLVDLTLMGVVLAWHTLRLRRAGYGLMTIFPPIILTGCGFAIDRPRPLGQGLFYLGLFLIIWLILTGGGGGGKRRRSPSAREEEAVPDWTGARVPS